MSKRIAVFGSSRVSQDSPEALQAYDLGRLLALAGFEVMSGGYEGIMSAVSKGAADAGGSTIGVSARPIETLRNIEPNPWVKQVVPFDTLRERLMYLVTSADGCVVLPGGLGTMAELMMAWEMVRVGDIAPRPVLCLGSYWENILAPLRSSPYLRNGDWDVMEIVDSIESVVDKLRVRLA